MEDKYKYYSYAIIFLNIILFSIILKSLTGYLLIIESIIFFSMFVFSLYLIYTNNDENLLNISFLAFFAFSTINALSIFIPTRNYYSILLSILNLSGLYCVIFSIPQKNNFYVIPNSKKDTVVDEVDTSYTIGKNSEIKKIFEKETSKIPENTHYLPNEERDINEDLLDESEIVIEEIKPIVDKSEKKVKRNKPKNKKN